MAPEGVLAEEGRGCSVHCDGSEEEVLWAPALAVFRAVDAVLSGGGRPRVSFVLRDAVSRRS